METLDTTTAANRGSRTNIIQNHFTSTIDKIKSGFIPTVAWAASASWLG